MLPLGATDYNTFTFCSQSWSLHEERVRGERKELQMKGESDERRVEYTRERKREGFPNYLGKGIRCMRAFREWEWRDRVRGGKR